MKQEVNFLKKKEHAEMLKYEKQEVSETVNMMKQ